jgi:uncharacterized protein DUF3310
MTQEMASLNGQTIDVDGHPFVVAIRGYDNCRDGSAKVTVTEPATNSWTEWHVEAESAHPEIIRRQAIDHARKIIQARAKAVKPVSSDPVSHPAHYTSHPSGIEAIQITEAFSFCVGNAIKYLWRAGLKSADPRQDMAKAIWYIQRELDRLERVKP